MSSFNWNLPTFAPGQVSQAGGVGVSTGSLLGKGLAFPLRMDAATNDFQRAVDEDCVDQCLRQLIFTAVGERFDPLIGTAVPDMPFDSNDVVSDIAQPSIVSAIRLNEPRVIIIKLSVVSKQLEGGASGIVIYMSYVVRATNQQRNRVWPFVVPEGRDV